MAVMFNECKCTKYGSQPRNSNEMQQYAASPVQRLTLVCMNLPQVLLGVLCRKPVRFVGHTQGSVWDFRSYRQPVSGISHLQEQGDNSSSVVCLVLRRVCKK